MAWEQLIHHEPNRGNSVIGHYTADLPIGLFKLTADGTGVVIRTGGQEVDMQYNHPDHPFFFELDRRAEVDFDMDAPNGELNLFILTPELPLPNLNS